MTNVRPPLSTASRSRPSTSREERESSAPVGSSANTTSGRATSARAIATRCCWPPESSAGRWRARSAEPDLAQRLGHGAAREAAAGEPRRQLDVLLGGQRAEQVEGLEHEPDVVAAQAGEGTLAHAGQLLPGELDRAAGRAVEPGGDQQQRGLAGPGRAHDGGEGAGGEGERDAVEGAHGAVAAAVHADEVVHADGRGERAGGALLEGEGERGGGHGPHGPIGGGPCLWGASESEGGVVPTSVAGLGSVREEPLARAGDVARRRRRGGRSRRPPDGRRRGRHAPARRRARGPGARRA